MCSFINYNNDHETREENTECILMTSIYTITASLWLIDQKHFTERKSFLPHEKYGDKHIYFLLIKNTALTAFPALYAPKSGQPVVGKHIFPKTCLHESNHFPFNRFSQE